MQTHDRQGRPHSPVRLIELLTFRFGAFTALARAALALCEIEDADGSPPMGEETAWAVLQFAADLEQAYRAAAAWGGEEQD